MNEANETVEELDVEWMRLIIEAKNLGIQKEEIRQFLSESSVNE